MNHTNVVPIGLFLFIFLYLVRNHECRHGHCLERKVMQTTVLLLYAVLFWFFLNCESKVIARNSEKIPVWQSLVNCARSIALGTEKEN